MLPHLTICCTVWGNSPHVNRLEKLQKRAVRLIFDLNQRDSTVNYFKILKWLPLSQLIDFKTVIKVYKSLKGLTPDYLSDVIHPIEVNSNRLTRSSKKCNLAIPHPRISKYQRSFSYPGPLLWNKLDLLTQTAPTIQSFKQQYLKS